MPDPNVLIVIPARGGSKRLPGKNLKLLGGRSLLEWTDKAVRDSGIDAPCLLTTDKEDIAEAGRALGWTVPFLRPNELASDTATTLDTVLHALDWWQSHEKCDPEYVMLLQVTSPFRDACILKDGIELILKNPDANAVVGVSRIRHGSLFQISKDGYFCPLEKKGGDNGIVAPNGALYIVRSHVLREQKTFFPTKTIPMLIDDESSLDIDTDFDWAIAEMIVEKRKLLNDNACD